MMVFLSNLFCYARHPLNDFVIFLFSLNFTILYNFKSPSTLTYRKTNMSPNLRLTGFCCFCYYCLYPDFIRLSASSNPSHCRILCKLCGKPRSTFEESKHKATVKYVVILVHVTPTKSKTPKLLFCVVHKGIGLKPRGEKNLSN